MVLQINENWFTAVNSLAGKNPILDAIMIFSAQYLVYIIPLILLYLWFRDDDKNFSLFLFFTVILGLIISEGIHLVYYHPRPFVLGLGTQLISHEPDSSFPSDHTVAMFSFALPFLFFKRYKSGTVFVLLASLVGFARVFVGVHFPFDIISGFFVGVASTYILYIFRDVLFRYFSKIISAYNFVLKRMHIGGR